MSLWIPLLVANPLNFLNLRNQAGRDEALMIAMERLIAENLAEGTPKESEEVKALHQQLRLKFTDSRPPRGRLRTSADRCHLPLAITLEVLDEIQRAMRVPVPERQARLMIELACALYQREILSFGKAAELSALSQFLFKKFPGTGKWSDHTNKIAADGVRGRFAIIASPHSPTVIRRFSARSVAVRADALNSFAPGEPIRKSMDRNSREHSDAHPRPVPR